MAETDRAAARRPRYFLTATAALGGLLLFVWAVDRAGAREIADGVRRVGWGIGPILALAGLRFVLRAEAWRLCMPPAARMPFRRAFTAFLAGDAIGNVIPLGLLASEPTKVFLTRHQLVTREAVASLAVDNLVYAGSVLLVFVVGLATLLVTVPLPFAWREAGVAALVGVAVGVAVAVRLLRHGTWNDGRGPRPRWRERLAALRSSVLRFSSGHPARLWRVLALDLCFHLLAVVEVFLTLRWLLGDASPTLSQAVIFEALNRVVTAVFKFVPLRVGVDEAASGALAPLLGVTTAAGVTLAVVRKARNLFWTAVGLMLISAHPARAASGTGPPESVSAHRI